MEMRQNCSVLAAVHFQGRRGNASRVSPSRYDFPGPSSSQAAAAAEDAMTGYTPGAVSCVKSEPASCLWNLFAGGGVKRKVQGSGGKDDGFFAHGAWAKAKTEFPCGPKTADGDDSDLRDNEFDRAVTDSGKDICDQILDARGGKAAMA